MNNTERIKVYGILPAKRELQGITRDMRVKWMLEELELPYDHVVLDPQKGETKSESYLKLNPTGKVPTLVDGHVTLFESAAICSYLAHREGKLLPEIESGEHWIAQQWICYILTNIEPHTARTISCDFFYDQNEQTAFARKLATDALARMLQPLEKILEKNQFLMGDDFSLPDLLLATCLMYTKHTDLLDSFQNLKSFYVRCLNRPAYSRSL